jgi:hypothetical protein
MLPVDFTERNFVFTKPNDMTDEQCSDLPVFKGQTSDGFPCIVSCWKLSKEDLEEVTKNGVVYLSITGHGMPPVSLFTENPFIQTESNG